MKGRLRHLLTRAGLRGPRPTILMYHRVAKLARDPWELAVSPHHFEAQLDYLVRYRTPMPLDAFIAGLDSGRLPSDAVAITFDDGYADNYHAALPLLLHRGLAAMLFLVTGHAGASRAFWWDELTRLILDHRGAIDTVVRIAATEFKLKWRPTDGHPLDWHAADVPSDARHPAFLDIWQAMRGLVECDREAAMERLRDLLGPVCMQEDRTMTRAELEAFVSSGLFSIGAHSRTHAALSTLAPAEAELEIKQSKAECETIAGYPVKGFAYPYGDMSQTVRDCVARSGFDWACSTEPGHVLRVGYDRFSLPRLAVRDWDDHQFARALA